MKSISIATSIEQKIKKIEKVMTTFIWFTYLYKIIIKIMEEHSKIIYEKIKNNSKIDYKL